MPRRTRGRGRKIDFTHWTYGSFSHGAQAAGTAASNLFGAQHEPETILRIRGSYVAYMDTPSAPGALVSIGVGFILVPEGSGATVTWSPITDGDAPWIWVDYAMIGYEEMVTDVVDVPMLSGVRRIIDSKAMRITRNQEVQMVVENVTVGNAAAVNVFGQLRLLAGK